ncbi:MAG TPA: hypothetical protein VK952_03770 [Methylotenera sp.]|nr:hypothetical protein [Methylotenera sp.]
MSGITILMSAVMCHELVSVQANLCEAPVKPKSFSLGGRSQNRRLQRGLPA